MLSVPADAFGIDAEREQSPEQRRSIAITLIGLRRVQHPEELIFARQYGRARMAEIFLGRANFRQRSHDRPLRGSPGKPYGAQLILASYIKHLALTLSRVVDCQLRPAFRIAVIPAR